MTQQGFDGQNLAGEFRQWRIPADWLIQIELAWLIAATLLGGYLSGLPTDNWWAWAYRTWAGGNVLGLFVLGNTAGYLTYEEVRMVLSGIFHREKVADILAKRAQAEAERAEAEAKSEARIKAMQAEVEAKLRAEQAEAEAKLRAEQAEAEAKLRAEAEAKLSVMVDAAVSKAMADTVGPMAAARDAALEEYRQAVAAWYERQQAAQRAGQPFAEPPPGGGGNGGNGGGPAG